MLQLYANVQIYYIVKLSLFINKVNDNIKVSFLFGYEYLSLYICHIDINLTLTIMNTALIEALGLVAIMAAMMAIGFLILTVMYDLNNKQHGNNEN